METSQGQLPCRTQQNECKYIRRSWFISQQKGVSVEVVEDVTFFEKYFECQKKIESNLQFQSKQIDRESTDPEKDSCTSIDD